MPAAIGDAFPAAQGAHFQVAFQRAATALQSNSLQTCCRANVLRAYEMRATRRRVKGEDCERRDADGGLSEAVTRR